MHQAKNSSPNSSIVLIGDKSNYKGIQIELLEHLQSDDLSELKKYYIHRSTNIEEFEFFCWERWFYLRNYMRKYHIASALYLDSDVLLYSSIDEIKNAYSDITWRCGLSIPKEGPASGHCSYWTIDCLEDFCRFTIESFRDQKYVAVYEKKWDWHLAQKVPGGVCDMTTLYLFYELYADRIINIAQSYKFNVFDNNMNSASNYKSNQYIVEHGIKKVKFINNRPYFLKVYGTEELDQVHALHFQGSSKRHIKNFYTGRPFPGKTFSDLFFFLRCVASKIHNLIGS